MRTWHAAPAENCKQGKGVTYGRTRGIFGAVLRDADARYRRRVGVRACGGGWLVIPLWQVVIAVTVSGFLGVLVGVGVMSLAIMSARCDEQEGEE